MMRVDGRLLSNALCLDHKTILTPPPFIEVPVPSQESERSCICVLFFVLLDNFIALCISKILWGGWKGVRRGRFRMVVGFTTNCAITTYHY